MSIDRSVIEHAARLAGIALTDEEVERFTGQLASVLQAVERLRTVDTEHISPTASVLPLENVQRDDVVRPSLPAEDVFANVPRGGRDGEFFRVQTSLEER